MDSPQALSHLLGRGKKIVLLCGMLCCWLSCNENKWLATGTSVYLTELHNCPAVLRCQAYGRQLLIKQITLINMCPFQYAAQFTWSLLTETMAFIQVSTIFTVSFATFQPVSCTSNFFCGGNPSEAAGIKRCYLSLM